MIDTESVDWGSYVAVPAMLEGTHFKGFSLRFFNFQSIPAPKGPTTDFRALKVYNPDGKLIGTVHDIIAERWNSEGIPHEPGEHQFVVGDELLCEYSDVRFETGLSVYILVERRFYFGHLPIHLRGLRDEQTGGIVTRQFRTDFIEPYAIEQGKVEGWQQIADPNQLAVTPVLRMGYSDHLPTLEEWQEKPQP